MAPTDASLYRTVTRQFGSRPQISIDLNGQGGKSSLSYTTSDLIEGKATIITEDDIDLDRIAITFEGVARVDKESTGPPSTIRTAKITKTFMRLRYHIDTQMARATVLKDGMKYTIPFSFVVPDRLSPRICGHQVKGNEIQLAHTLLPPTICGARSILNRGSGTDDFTPGQCEVSYLVVARIVQPPGEVLMAHAKRVDLVPCYDKTPWSIQDMKPYSVSALTRGIRSSLTRQRRGRVVMTALQPKPIELLGSEQATDNGTWVMLHIGYEPAGGELPPLLQELRSSLEVSTFYTCDHQDSVTGLWSSDIAPGQFTRILPLSSLCLSSAKWTKRETDVETGFQKIMWSSEGGEHESWYTVSIVVPINLPKDKALVPTFESCLISRLYSVRMLISYRPTDTMVSAAKVCLEVPIVVKRTQNSARCTGVQT